ncbi:MAG TPA: hypothetical protein DCR93_09170, partial [Cytophagales bacterium]|nr:hypothetical protein [Cytophagales bacterium]
MLIQPDQTYNGTLYVHHGGNPTFDYKDIELIAKPACQVDSYWERHDVYDTLAMSVYYHKPVSPIELSTDLDTWYVIADADDTDDTNDEVVTVKLSGYDVYQQDHALKEVILEYKGENSTVWTRMFNATNGETAVSIDTLRKYYEQKFNVYPDPLYPFVWDISGLDMQDGTYQIRAMVVHPNGSFAYSDVLTGAIDRTQPRLLNLPEPADGLWSAGDPIVIEFDEDINDTEFLSTSAHWQVYVIDFAGDTTFLDYDADFPGLSDYEVRASGNAITFVIDDDKLKEYDGYGAGIRTTGIYDYWGNPSYWPMYEWNFVIDYFKRTPSPVSLVGPGDNWLVNSLLVGEANTLNFVITDYDLFEASTSLDSITLEYQRADETWWTQVNVLTRDQLQANYATYGLSGQGALDTLRWGTVDTADGEYQ